MAWELYVKKDIKLKYNVASDPKEHSEPTAEMPINLVQCSIIINKMIILIII